MAVRHIEAEYMKVCAQREQVIQDLKDLTEEANNGIIAPEVFEEMKKNIQPILDNYKLWSWIMYLLHKPNRKSKEKKYDRANKKMRMSIEKER